MKADFDIAIIGSGLGGSLMAMVVRRLGYSVVLLERGSHPRFAIGESSSPMANLLLERIGLEYDLPRLLPLTTWGAWQAAYPEIGCGLKRGFTYYHHHAGERFDNRPDRSNQLLVAASPSDRVSDTHWYRPDFDHFLQREAVATGADYLDHTLLDSVGRQPDGSWTLVGNRHDRPVRIAARFMVDATGPRGFLSRALNLPAAKFAGYPATEALFSHFTDVPRCEDLPDFALSGSPPYHPDDAALHHFFDGGWMWVLRFNNGITSAGFAAEPWLARELRIEEGAPAFDRYLDRFPSIREQFAPAKPTLPFVHARLLPYRGGVASGNGWAMLPSAAAFIDPLFSTGFPLTLLGILRLGQLLREGLDDVPTAEYGETTLQEADGVARFVGACYRAFRNPERFIPLSMFYFAAASYGEIAVRTGKTERVKRFMALDDSRFQDGLSACIQAMDARNLDSMVAEAIEHRNIAGLCDPAKRNWYPVDLDDVVRGANKLGIDSEQMRQIIATAEWAQSG